MLKGKCVKSVLGELVVVCICRNKSPQSDLGHPFIIRPHFGQGCGRLFFRIHLKITSFRGTLSLPLIPVWKGKKEAYRESSSCNHMDAFYSTYFAKSSKPYSSSMLYDATATRSVCGLRWLYILDTTVEHRQEKMDVKLIKYVDYVFGQIFNHDVFVWFACGD